MKKLVATAFMLGIVTAPAFAQGKESEPLEILDRDKKLQAEALDKQYKTHDGAEPQRGGDTTGRSLVQYAGAKRRQRKVTAEAGS